MTPTTEQLKDLLARAPDGPWSANYASGEINGGASGAYPVIDMNTETYDRATACVTLDDSEVSTLGLIALAPTLAAEVVRLREALEKVQTVYQLTHCHAVARQALDATTRICQTQPNENAMPWRAR